MRQHLEQAGLAERITVDSAGTHNYHPGKAPDARSQKHAAQRCYDLANLRARQVTDEDFERFDLILTMDWDNRALLEQRCPSHLQHKIRGFAEFLKTSKATVIPDPYYGDEKNFEHVLDLVEEASEGLMEFVIKKVRDHE
jgi:protein-tyrosine phosphatase